MSSAAALSSASAALASLPSIPGSAAATRQAADGPSSSAAAAPSATTAAAAQDVKKEEAEEELPLAEDAHETVYVRNLNEKVRLPVLKETLTNLVSLYGSVLSVTAHANLRMRGQAFVALDDKRAANRAVKEVQGFPLYGRPMQLGFAKTRSDSVVKRDVKQATGLRDESAIEDADEFQAHKRARLEHKAAVRVEVRRKAVERKAAEKRAAEGEGGDYPTGATGGATHTTSSTAQRRQNVQLPDEYVPPNKILFLQNIAARVGKDELEALFAPLPNLVEVRTIPGKSDIAFVEFADIPSSAAAREKLNGHAFADGSKLKITFARA